MDFEQISYEAEQGSPFAEQLLRECFVPDKSISALSAIEREQMREEIRRAYDSGNAPRGLPALTIEERQAIRDAVRKHRNQRRCDLNREQPPTR